MKDEIKDYIDHALVSTRGLTSDLASEVIRKMKEDIEKSVAIAIEKNVNGKIRRLDEKMEEYIKSDLKWKDEYSPYLKGIESISIGGKIVFKFLVGVATLGTALLVIKKWFF